MLRIASLLAALMLASPISHAADPPRAAMPEKHRAMLQEHCAKCHDAKTQKGKFRVDDLPYAIGNVEAAERWQKVLNALNSNEMPPEGETQPSPKVKADFLDDLANTMVAARRSLSDQRGRVTMRRLNRREYGNTLRDLLGVEINVAELPADTGTGGFDTVGSNLFMSSNQFEQYLSLGREALEEAFERQAAAGEVKKLRQEGEESLPRIQKFVEDHFEAHERGKNWVAAAMAAAAKPENAAIVAELRKSVADDAALRRAWKKIPGAPSPESFGFQTGENNADKANRAAGLVANQPFYKYFLALPHLDTGTYLTIGQQQDINSWLVLLAPFKWPVGEYVVRIRIAAVDDAPPERRFLEFGINPRHGKVLSTHAITGTMANPQVIEIPLTLTRGHTDRSDRMLYIREKGTADHIDQVRRRVNEARSKNGIGPTAVLWVDWFDLEYRPVRATPSAPGLAALRIPLDDESKPPSAQEVKSALERFAKEAFRGREPGASYLDRLAAIYAAKRAAGDKHSAALKDTLAVILASPMLLYLSEPVADDAQRKLTEFELAARLSYFLWGAPPDAVLKDLARRGELSRPDVLSAQVDRLLADLRSGDFVQPFIYQWLGLDRLDFFQVNRGMYPRFDDSTKLASRNEVYETFAYLLKHDASLADLLKSDYVVVNGVMANYYGMTGVTGDAFRKVALPAGSPRGGLLGMAAVSVMGGNGERTNPVERGAWVLRKLLNDPPPPAPANVPQLARLAGKILTTRERLQAHQEQAQCMSCHRKIDPIGFGLENFDAVGAWRTEDSYALTDERGRPNSKAMKTWTIDPAAAFHNGPAFKDYFEMREIIASKSDAFARGFSAALVEYALGRPVGFSDEALFESMLRQARTKNLAPREFIRALVLSKEFQTK